MTTLTDQAVTDYLLAHPDFFTQHHELLATLTVPGPHAGKAISLVERQNLTLREKNKQLELKLSQLLHFGRENDQTADKLHRWTHAIVRVQDNAHIPMVVAQELIKLFALPDVALRLWGVQENYAHLDCAAPVAVDTILFANALSTPYCGIVENNTDVEKLGVAQWLPGGENAPAPKSLALLALRQPDAAESFGLIVLASQDPERFADEMGTLYLQRIAELASAVLSRLID
ncbi:DUF484 family protein [Parvibium lacunae]|uniref:DUF484 family protein n=1 Tax=Parvibium lacunae TaxID=1888893 RepID=A0A368L4W8_9BURK|nr:DUF484 family protein [Parvibium lacunae]RCS58629.1 DUF484 family protein [Parvibium lacunae]